MPFDSSPAAVVQRQLDAYNAHDLEAWAATYASNAEQYEYPVTRLAAGRENIRARMVARFSEPNLQATLINRIVLGQMVVDHERITRTFPEGPGYVELVAIYEVVDGKIVRATFRFGDKVLDFGGARTG